MFHVEHGGFVRTDVRISGIRVAFAVLVASLIGCKKADPVPETKDGLYQSLQTELSAAKGEVSAAEASVKEAEDELKKVVPQTGQIKYAQKRYWEARNKLTLAQQRVRGLEVQAEMRMWKARVSSLEAFHQGKEWSEPESLQMYVTQQELQRKSRSWSVKDRRAALGLTTGPQSAEATSAAASAGGHGEAPAGESGGHH